MHMMEICLSGNWVCARDGPWRFPEKFLSWIQAEKCGWVPGWNFPDITQLGNIDGPVVGKWYGKELLLKSSLYYHPPGCVCLPC